ncbi:hypothetical protein AWC02_08215 [Mycolicibacter engbaekii]|uniref:Uncharacterized protein n=1 Tax=Mycolicibacter engbaekii TaxID=188915 RepID=A0A1X1TTD8_9MYCO|nr:hypothetical protein AWC02_08215 [Mycolicibacter engbaekii]
MDLIGKQVSLDVVLQWTEEGFSPWNAATFVGAGVSLSEARKWNAVNIAAPDAVRFICGGITVATASEWLEKTELSAEDVVDFIQKDVSLAQAKDFGRRGIGSHQVTRTDAGLELDLEPWQEEPIDQLPKAIEPGDVHITVWTTAFGGHPVAHDVDFSWDGAHTAEWHEDISGVNGGLSIASSSPARGVLAWPDSKDVLLTYTWSELGLEGHARLVGMAPTNGGCVSDPAQWVRLSDAIVKFVLVDLGSSSDERSVEYLDKARDHIVDIHDASRQYLTTNSAISQIDFGSWLEMQLATGRYKDLHDGD